MTDLAPLSPSENGRTPASERERSRVAATRRGVHSRLAVLDPGHAPTFNPGKTLKLRVEFVRQLKRRRTQVTAGLLLLLPIIIALAFKIGGSADASAPQLVGLATAGGINFALFAEFATVGFLLVVVVALFCGDTVASEASWASLRYLLAQPVPRARLLKQKFIVAGVLCIAANVLLPVWAFFVGGVFFGFNPVESPIGGTFDNSAAVWRFLIVVAYVCGQLLVTATLAFLLSTAVDNPLGAVGGAVMLHVVSTIIDQITALKSYRNFLPSHYNYAWVDVLSSPIRWDDMMRGTGVALVYSAVFLGYAFLRFERKDVTS